MPQLRSPIDALRFAYAQQQYDIQNATSIPPIDASGIGRAIARPERRRRYEEERAEDRRRFEAQQDVREDKLALQEEHWRASRALAEKQAGLQQADRVYRRGERQTDRDTDTSQHEEMMRKQFGALQFAKAKWEAGQQATAAHREQQYERQLDRDAREWEQMRGELDLSERAAAQQAEAHRERMATSKQKRELAVRPVKPDYAKAAANIGKWLDRHQEKYNRLAAELGENQSEADRAFVARYEQRLQTYSRLLQKSIEPAMRALENEDLDREIAQGPPDHYGFIDRFGK